MNSGEPQNLEKKKEYVTPKLVVYGDMGVITQNMSATASHMADGGLGGFMKT
ncbi:MAG TPA: hypothetical protein VFE02_19955 [Candidatus Acidoferrales bacterium]|jgi:hypothetical protein|nr:hypothetical protein [Candidatus Acidoferrales bacterium]